MAIGAVRLMVPHRHRDTVHYGGTREAGSSPGNEEVPGLPT